MVNGKKVIVIVPARGGSKSIPRKNLKLLGGHPLIAYSIAAGKQSKFVDRVIVSTDDVEIGEKAKKYGGEVPFLRPSHLAQDETTDFPVIKHVLSWLGENENYYPDLIVQLRPTSPFRPLNCVDEAVEKLVRDLEADSIRGVTPSGQNPFKMWKIEEDRMQPLLEIEFDEPYNMPRQKLPKTFWQTGHIDVFRYNTVMKKNSLTGDKILPFPIDPAFAIDIDTPKHWVFAEWLMNQGDLQIVRPDRALVELFEGIKMIVFDFDGVFTDNKVYVMQNGQEAIMCSRGDGMGIEMLREKGIKMTVLSRESNTVVNSRCQKLKIPCYHGAKNKLGIFQNIVSMQGLTAEEVIYVGNDVNDLECMKAAKLAIAVADAHPKVLREADWILSKSGGHEAVRELCELFFSSIN